MNIFYSKHNGYWPYYANGKPVNGGIPQLGNLTKHLELFLSNVSSMIVDPEYDGLDAVFSRTDPLLYYKVENMVIFRSGNLYSLFTPVNQHYHRIIYFLIFSSKRWKSPIEVR